MYSGGLLEILWGLFVSVSPLIAIVAIVQWSSASKRKRQNGGMSDYQLGYRDGYANGVKASDNIEDESFGDQQATEINNLHSANAAPSALAVADSPVYMSQSPDPQEAVDDDQSSLATDTYKTGTVLVQPELTPEEKSRRTLNMLLSLSSLLFVAAGIAFIVSGFSDAVKLVGILGIVVVFYGGGMALHRSSEVLRPAALAFIGTGLALVPFLGIAFSAYTPMNASMAWLVTSLIGIAAYMVAAVYLQNPIVSYFTVAFMLSLVGSTVASASLPLMWYFVAMIAFSLLASVVSYFRPSWLPELFRAPVEQAGNLVTPVAVLGSLLSASWLQLYHYEIIFSLTTLQYVVAMLQQRSYFYEQVVRVLLHITILIFAYDFTDTSADLGVAFVILLVAQQLYSVVRTIYAPQGANSKTEYIWLWICFGGYLISPAFWLLQDSALLNTMLLGLILSMSVYVSYTLRRVEFGYIGLFALLVLPAYVGLALIQPSAPAWSIAVTYSILTAVALIAYFLIAQHRSAALSTFAIAACLVFISAASLSLLAVPGNSIGIILSVVLVGLYVALSYIRTKSYDSVFIAIPVSYLTFRIASLLGLSGGEAGFTITGLAAVISYVLAAVFVVFGSRAQRNVMIALGQAWIVPFALSSIGSFTLISSDSAKLFALLVLLTWLVGSWICKRLAQDDSPNMRLLFGGSYLTYYALALVIAYTFSAGWVVGLLGLGIALIWELSYTERVPTLAFLANIFSLWMLYELVRLIGTDTQWIPMIIAVTSFGLFYSGYWLLKRFVGDIERQLAMLYSSWTMLGFGFLVASFSPVDTVSIVGATVFLLGSATVLYEGFTRKNSLYYEIALYMVTLAISLILSRVFSQADQLVYVHIWALAIGLAGYIRKQGPVRYIVAMGLITVFVGLKALAEGGVYSLIFLIEHVTLAVIGAARNKTWATRWGIIASVLAAIYYLRDIPFLAFTLLGIVVVSFVIWRLKQAKR